MQPRIARSGSESPVLACALLPAHRQYPVEVAWEASWQFVCWNKCSCNDRKIKEEQMKTTAAESKQINHKR
jgi:hypothetical protein